MYNRYIRNDRGTYTRIPEEDGPPHKEPYQGPPPGPSQGPPPGPSQGPPPGSSQGPPPGPYQDSNWGPRPEADPENMSPPKATGISQTLHHLLDRLHLNHVDTGDLLLLVLFFLISSEDVADDELLIALGLLFIL